MTTNSPGKDFTLWLEKTTLENYGHQNNTMIAKEVDRLIQASRAPLIAIISELVLSYGVDCPKQLQQVREAIHG